MSKADFLALLEEIMDLARGSLKGDEALEDIPWDSLSVVSFIALVDEHLGVAVNPQALSEAKSIPDVLGLVASKLN